MLYIGTNFGWRGLFNKYRGINLVKIKNGNKKQKSEWRYDTFEPNYLQLVEL